MHVMGYTLVAVRPTHRHTPGLHIGLHVYAHVYPERGVYLPRSAPRTWCTPYPVSSTHGPASLPHAVSDGDHHIPRENAMIDEWDEEIDVITRALRDAGRDRDDCAPGSGLYAKRQHEADSWNYRKSAFQVARPVLVKLINQLGSRHDNEVRHRRDIQDRASTWLKVSIYSGLFGGLFLLIGLRVSWAPWWFTGIGIVMILTAAVTVASSVMARSDGPDTTMTNTLAGRIAAIEDACWACWDAAGLEAVERLLDAQRGKPGRPGNEVARRAR